MSDHERDETIAYLERKVAAGRKLAADPEQRDDMRVAFRRIADRDQVRLGELCRAREEARR